MPAALACAAWPTSLRARRRHLGSARNSELSRRFVALVAPFTQCQRSERCQGELVLTSGGGV